MEISHKGMKNKKKREKTYWTLWLCVFVAKFLGYAKSWNHYLTTIN